MPDSTHAITVLIVDNAPLFRRALTALLNRRRNLRVVGESATGAEAIARAASLSPDVVVIDPAVDDGGPDLVTGLCQASPDSTVLVLALEHDDEAAGRLLQAGARGYLTKQCDPDDLMRAIERVHAGELTVARAVAATVVKALTTEPGSGPAQDSLTEREREVLRLVARGLTNRQIAEQLCITEHTVKAHLAKILGKLGLNNRVQLTAYALQNGITQGRDSPKDG